MRNLWLPLFIVLAFLIYALSWFMGRASIQSQVGAGLETLNARGWTVTYDSYSFGGFPSRLEQTWRGLAITSPSGLRFETPSIKTHQLVYDRSQTIVLVDQRSAVIWGDRRWNLSADAARISVGPGLPWPNPATFETGAATLTGPDGMQISWDSGLFATRQASVDDEDVYLRLTGLHRGTSPDHTLEFSGTVKRGAPSGYGIGRATLDPPTWGQLGLPGQSSEAIELTLQDGMLLGFTQALGPLPPLP